MKTYQLLEAVYLLFATDAKSHLAIVPSQGHVSLMIKPNNIGLPRMTF